MLPLGFGIVPPPPSTLMSPVGGSVRAAKVSAIDGGAAEVGAIDACASKASTSEVGAAGTALGTKLAGAGLGALVVVPVVVVGRLP